MIEFSDTKFYRDASRKLTLFVFEIEAPKIIKDYEKSWNILGVSAAEAGEAMRMIFLALNKIDSPIAKGLIIPPIGCRSFHFMRSEADKKVCMYCDYEELLTK